MESPQEHFLYNILFFAEEVTMPSIDQAQASQWIRNTITSEESSYASINIIFCSDEFLIRLNKKHLAHDYYTDIITFQYEKEPIEGELYISIDRVKENAQERKTPYLSELHRVIIHGVLHMIGYGDKSEQEQKIIRSKEDHYLTQIV